jgi:hypothetical protein
VGRTYRNRTKSRSRVTLSLDLTWPWRRSRRVGFCKWSVLASRAMYGGWQHVLGFAWLGLTTSN